MSMLKSPRERESGRGESEGEGKGEKRDWAQRKFGSFIYI